MVSTGNDLQFLYEIAQRSIDMFTTLNHYKIGGFGLLEILIAFLLLSIVVPILFRMAGYDTGED